MELGYINFSNEEKNNLYKVIQSIRDHHAIDELGIGRIRDAFSNKMFPGMSTLHNRAKYFAVLPALYYQAEKGHYNSVREVRQHVLDLEIKLTRQLINGCDNSADNWGITGSTMIDAAERNSSKYVKYDPSYIYWGGLVTYEMVKTDGNVYQLIYERARHSQDHPNKRRQSQPEEHDGDSSDLLGRMQLFDTGGLSYTFDGKTPISTKLTKDEAKYILRRITESKGSKESLLAYLLLHPEIPTDINDYLDLGSVWNELPEKFRLTYALSARFSKFIYLLRVFYNYIYIKKTQDEEAAKPMLQAYYDYLNANKEELTRDKIIEVLAHVDKDVEETTVKTFVLNCAQYVEADDRTKLEDCIVDREKTTKGAARAKLTNGKKYVGKGHVEAAGLDYRWSLVHSMLKEIKEGLEYGK